MYGPLGRLGAQCHYTESTLSVVDCRVLRFLCVLYEIDAVHAWGGRGRAVVGRWRCRVDQCVGVWDLHLVCVWLEQGP